MFAKLVLTALVTFATALPFPDDDAVGLVWQFPKGTWIENLAVRQSGEVLASSLSRSALYQVDPFRHTETTIAQFGGDGVLGIAEVENDVFVVVTAQVNLATSAATPGSAKAWKVDMVTWSLVCGLVA
jgi:streptogramin lyase